jgi:hypothetical protein
MYAIMLALGHLADPGMPGIFAIVSTVGMD